MAYKTINIKLSLGRENLAPDCQTFLSIFVFDLFTNLNSYLELDELGPPGLEVEPAAALVHPAVVGRAHDQRHERSRTDRLVRLAAALVARVSGHLRKVKLTLT